MAASTTAAESGFVPYRPGPMSSLVAWASRQPGRGWWLYLALGVATFAWGQAVEWLSGRMPLGDFDLNLVALTPYGAYSLAAVTLGIRIARRALNTFWPATGWPESDRPAWAYRFTYGPFWPETLALLVGAAAGIAALLGTPVSILGPESGRGAVLLAYLPAFLEGYALLVAATLTTLRWLRIVARIQREATAVDIFDRVPIYAFSRVTVLVSLSYLIGTTYSIAVNGAFQAGNVTAIASLGASLALAIVIFTAPMWGIHDRLAGEKEALLKGVERRTNLLAAELYARIDDGRFDSTEAINDSLTGLTVLRDRIERLPTWPWPPQLLRGFVSALLLPIVVYVLTRAIGGLIIV